MNQKQAYIETNRNWHHYHIPGQSNLQTLKKNAIFISAANSIEHERKKFEICYDLKKQGHDFITEAELNKCKDMPIIRRDIVDITTGEVYEIETEQSSITHKKETQKDVEDFDRVIWVKI
jgi:hypothetical protein